MNFYSYVGGEVMKGCSRSQADISLSKSAPSQALAKFFSAFGDSTRMRILLALTESELCVCDLSQLIGGTQSAISHQLQVLRACGAVKCRREGKTIFYSIADGRIESIINMGIAYLEE